ncbi:hypothetical protein D1872_178150 [compost metagenome]
MMITQCKRAGVVGYEGQHERMGQISSEGIASDPVQHTAKRLGSRIFLQMKQQSIQQKQLRDNQHEGAWFQISRNIEIDRITRLDQHCVTHKHE